MHGQGEKFARNPKVIKQFEAEAKKLWGKEGKLAKELCKAYQTYYNPSARSYWMPDTRFDKLHAAYADLCGGSAMGMDAFEGFWNSRFEAVLTKLLGSGETKRLGEICALIFESPYTYYGYRPSYRSKRVADYVGRFFETIIISMDLCCRELCMETQLADVIAEGFEGGGGFIADCVALALRRGEGATEAVVNEAILGDSGKVRLSHTIITGVIKSGVPAWLELLGQLLLAAKGQEGVRQAILESADCGSAETHAYFIKLMIDHNLTRFSAAVRAFDTWTGLSYSNAKPALIQKCLNLAYEQLQDGGQFAQGIQSADTLEIYMALWGAACRDIHAAGTSARELLEAKEGYRRLVGWYFLYSTAHDQTKHELAIDYLHVREPEELAWVCCCLYQHSRATHGRWGGETGAKLEFYPDAVFPKELALRRVQFEKLCPVLDFIGKKKTKFEGSVFPWMFVQLESHEVAKCLLGLAGYDRDPAMIQELAAYLPLMDANSRHAFYMNLLDPKIPAQRELLLAGLADKSADNKREVVKRLAGGALKPADIEQLTNALTTTSSYLRKEIMALLGKQSEALVRPAIQGLLASSKDKLLLAGVELLDIFGEQNPKLLAAFDEQLGALHGRENLPKDVAVILARFDPEQTREEYTPENGFGLFDPASVDFDKKTWAAKRPQVRIYNKSELKKLLQVDGQELRQVLLPIRDVLIKHKDLECEIVNYDGSRGKVLIGDNPYQLPLLPEAGRDPGSRSGGIRDYYLAEEILKAVDDAGISPLTIAKILNFGDAGSYDYGCKPSAAAKRIFQGLPIEGELDFDRHVKPYAAITRNILREVLWTRHEGLFDFAMSVWVSLFALIPESDLMSSYQTKNKHAYYYGYGYYEKVDCMLDIGLISDWRDVAFQARETDEQRIVVLREAWYQYLCTGQKRTMDGCVFCAKAFGLVGDDALYHELLIGAGARDHIRSLTASANWAKANQKQMLEKHPFLPDYMERAVERIVTVEEKRGELPTPLSGVASQIGYFKGGIGHFTTLLTALGKDNFFRGYTWGGQDQGKKTTLSLLLKHCYPRPGEGAEAFQGAIESAGISEKRLLQAVMYAPQWADLAEEALGIPGLASAVWLFHAHINEGFSAEKETRVALYSPITQQQFADGTFDKDWFLEAYHAVGQRIFDELYKNAKYITDSNSTHRRSQLYADAVLGRLDRGEMEGEIRDKRNQEKLRAYALIPLDEKNPGDALARYEFIQTFAKESKQFGAQRRASEGKAVLIALQNLALTTGFGDADRMSWYLESEKMDGLRHLMEPHDLDGTEVWLQIAEDGTPSVGVSKGGKALKALPKALSKDETVLEIQAAVKDLRDQKRRGRLSFEMAMVSRTVFAPDELLRLLGHPVLRGMVSALVFVSGDVLGFPLVKDGRLYLVAPDGVEQSVSETSGLIIAHPYDLMTGKCWSAYQQYLYREQMVQPFKQVFREYYPITEDELAEVNVSRRYAGHQVQPQKTVALLKSRGWTVDYDAGLQRVYHKENLIVRLYALADWFSPADIEAPTLEVVRFFARDTDEPLAFTAVPPVIFSEVMRDIDLVVSVAHVGGVDPEASHSTVEMRIAIAKELLALLAVDNVSFQSAHGMIRGSMGEYSVHMGSGLVHQSGVGMLAVIPVHAQARGRIFLPFADDDPKTAEIMSKILLFAADEKIKDPAILRQIGRGE
ncbi:MAG: DUF4132 domain-containing protein [Oscillospiraceae bacterium]|nr:DUF4132 domain-containing protein [Oscillospiraceae bacterium]